MIWISVLSTFLLFCWKENKPQKPSPGFLKHFDGAFVDWTRWLVDLPPADRHSPATLLACCPRLTTLRGHSALLDNLSPAGAFAYASTRVLAENAVQLGACWTLPSWSLLVAVLAWRTWGQQTISKESRHRRHKVHKWNQNYAWLLMSFFPLSIILPLLAELALGDFYHSLTGAHHKRNFVSRQFWREENRIYDLKEPSILDLFHPIRLHQALYGYHSVSPIGQSSYNRLCRQTAVSLSWWSVLGFVFGVYGIFALALHTVVWRPLRRLFPNLLLQNYGYRIRKLKGNCGQPEGDQINDTVCSKTVLDRRNKRSVCSADFQTNLPTSESPAKTPRDELMDQFDQFQYPDLDFLMSKKNESQPASSSQEKRAVAPENSKPGSGEDRGPPLNRADRPPRSTVKPTCVNRGISACR